jgi:hypothetical protein
LTGSLAPTGRPREGRIRQISRERRNISREVRHISRKAGLSTGQGFVRSVVFIFRDIISREDSSDQS